MVNRRHFPWLGQLNPQNGLPFSVCSRKPSHSDPSREANNASMSPVITRIGGAHRCVLLWRTNPCITKICPVKIPKDIAHSATQTASDSNPTPPSSTTLATSSNYHTTHHIKTNNSATIRKARTADLKLQRLVTIANAWQKEWSKRMAARGIMSRHHPNLHLFPSCMHPCATKTKWNQIWRNPQKQNPLYTLSSHCQPKNTCSANKLLLTCTKTSN